MTQKELDQYLYDAAEELNVLASDLIPIPKSELIVGYIYQGACRNSSRAIWHGDRFKYWRIKFGIGFWEDINHYEDDNGYDVFVPVKIKSS